MTLESLEDFDKWFTREPLTDEALVWWSEHLEYAYEVWQELHSDTLQEEYNNWVKTK